ncbi:hypothetical protein DVH24_025949 [Malus domestica]|uniref:Uncharacterized protein n=1 Tax=Malus domestica TaxID=3750 RepID=A0A498KNC9_MALDO|nr:hypothetical protein DVH24_025949 [Malus domestica]
MGRNREGTKMPSNGNKEEVEGDEEVIILYSTDYVPPILGAPNVRQNASSYSVPSRPMYQTVAKVLWDETEWNETRWDGTKWKESKDALQWKQGGRRRRQRCYNFVFHECETSRSRDETEQKFTQNSFCEIARSTHFKRTKRGIERFVQLHFVPSHVPNGT